MTLQIYGPRAEEFVISWRNSRDYGWCGTAKPSPFRGIRYSTPPNRKRCRILSSTSSAAQRSSASRPSRRHPAASFPATGPFPIPALIILRVRTSRSFFGSPCLSLTVANPRPHQPVEFVDLAFGTGFRHAVLEPTAQGNFNQLAGPVRMLGMDALCPRTRSIAVRHRPR